MNDGALFYDITSNSCRQNLLLLSSAGNGNLQESFRESLQGCYLVHLVLIHSMQLAAEKGAWEVCWQCCMLSIA